jgi:DNA-directed RNA polymerase specialized sigma24 family protein
MQDATDFDEFYKSARTGLLQQTFALTGDLPASRGAVRDAFVAAWHHWRKVSRLEDPEAWVRPVAWRHAQRRHSARLFHRDRKLDPEIRATLDALAKLPFQQRKILLLTQLANASMTDMAREVGLPVHDAERKLQTATSQFAMHRDVSTVGIRSLLEPIRDHVAEVRWPRVTIVRRAGTTRRRTHTAVGAVAVVSGLVLGGAVVTDAQGVRPSLATARVSGVVATSVAPTPSATPTDNPETETEAAPVAGIAADDLMTLDDVAGEIPGHWREVKVGGQTGILMPCQTTRFADPEGQSSAVSQFKAPARDEQPRRSVVQSAEMSSSTDDATATYATMLGWFGGCTDARVQLISTHAVDGVGDDASLLHLRSWKRPRANLLAGVARTGQATTITLIRTQGDGRPDLQRAARVLASAVNGLCRLPGTGPCAERPELKDRAPVAAGEVPSMLSEVDLPPVAGVERPWIGTQPRMAHDNQAATRCDSTSFDGPRMKRNMTRSFLIPEADLSDLFGLTETVGWLPPPRAREFVAGVRRELRKCADDQPGTEVVRVADVTTKKRDLTVWHVKTEISDEESVTYLMGIVRSGGSIAQIGFVPDGKVEMAPGAFITLAQRALDRIPALEPSAG